MIAVRTLYGALFERRVPAVNTLHQLLVHSRSVKDAINTLWERHVNVVGML